ncbi:MAG: hypothetical protein EXR76_09405 [Myxococcales bacterium]|nr:hypothetical protein [Myxococcales bacterium]
MRHHACVRLLLPVAFVAACASATSSGGDCVDDDGCPEGKVCALGRCGPAAVGDGSAVVDLADRAAILVADALVTDGPNADEPRLVGDGSGPSDDSDVSPPGDDRGLTDMTKQDAGGPDVPSVGPDLGPIDCEPGEVRACGRTQGRCRAGRQSCLDDRTLGPCLDQIGPTPEVCNGADDDCNGTADDGFDVGGNCDGVGDCGPGLVECRSDVLTRCSTDPGASHAGDLVETCNGTDEDCDGRIDETFMIGRPCPGQCGEGRLECAAAGDLICSTDPGGSVYEVSPEACNDADDDCDGRVDEDFARGLACEGIGLCGSGLGECGPLFDLICSTEAGGSEAEAGVEVCNAADDDCDGSTDETFALGRPCEGAGECGAGETECAADGRQICNTEAGGSRSAAGQERCNTRDDDCDGSIDEGLNLGGLCAAVGICSAGVFECAADGRVICSTGPGASEDEAAIEACNQIDDDCDGRADEDFSLGQACDGRGACGAGTRECAADGSARCSTEASGSDDESFPEGCNGSDDDCNGAVDDGAACGGDTCLTAPGIRLDEPNIVGNTAAMADDYARSACLANSPGRDQVYQFEAPAAGRYAVGIAPLDALLDLVFWTNGDCGSPTLCLANGFRDQSAAGRPEGRIINVPAAGSYYLYVDARVFGPGGPFLASVRPAADGETCGSAIVLPLPGRFAGTTEGRAADLAAVTCPNAGSPTVGPDQVFVFTPARAGQLDVVVTPGPNDVRFAVSLATNCGNLDASCIASAHAPMAGRPAMLSAAVVAGTQYTLVLDHVGQLGGSFFLDVSLR